MKRKLFVMLLVMVMIFSLSLTGCGDSGNVSSGDDGEVYNLICSHLTVENDSMHIGALKFKEMIEERSDGRILVDIYPNKQLASSDNEMIEQVRNNSVQMCITPNFIVASLNEGLKSLYIFDFPYMFESSDELYAFLDGEIGQAMNQEIYDKTNGVMTYGCYSPSWYKTGSTKKPIETVSDLAGVKIRTTTAKMAMETMSAFGANPTPINYGEVFTALQQGTVNGNATATNLMLTERYYEVMPYITDTNHVPHILYPFYNVEWVESLPEDLHAIFEECALDYLDWIRDYGEKVEKESLEGLEEVATVTYLTDDARKEFIVLGRSIWDKNADVVGGNEFLESSKAWLEDYRAGN